MKIIGFVLVIIFLVFNLQSQTATSIYDNEVVVYTQTINSNKSYIFQNGDVSIIYDLVEEECGDISPDGRYLVLSTTQPQTLKILHLPTKEKVFETDWNVNWNPCGLFWVENDTILIDVSGTNDLRFKFENLSLIEIPLEVDEIIYPSLPSFYPEIDENLLLQNPSNPNIYLYEKCPTGTIYEDSYCDDTQMVIYDLANNIELENLENASPHYMRGYIAEGYSRRTYVSNQLVSWSPNGRYLSYFNRIQSLSGVIPDEGSIIIYDLQMDRYFSDVNELYLPNINYHLHWSNNNILVIPRTGIFSDIYNYQFHGTLTYFTFLHPETETYVSADKLFDTLNNRLIFSPDGRAIIFLGKERIDPNQLPNFGDNPGNANLVIISTVNGESTVMDTDVTEIITWRSICDFTPLDTASLISTMQTEPYSVICLDAGQDYDLTSPLPDVTGNITIIGNGARINMTTQNRIFNVIYNQQWSRNGSLTLKNITISGGNATQGGAIYNAGDLILENVTLENNSAVRGGAIYNTGMLTMNGGAIQNNSATELGGGIYNTGEMSLDGVNITENDAPEGSGVYQG